MIFVTVGTTKFPFERLFKNIDQVMVDLGKQEHLIIQKGASRYYFRYPRSKVFSEVPFDKMIDYLKRARIIITHGGPATIFLALKYGRNKPLVVPRSKKFGEHVDEHEVLFAQFLKTQEETEVIFPHEDIYLRIRDYLHHPEKSWIKHKSRPSKKFIKKLTDFTQYAR